MNEEKNKRYEYWLVKEKTRQAWSEEDYTVIRRDNGPNGDGKHGDGSEISRPWECIASDGIFSDENEHNWWILIKKLDLEELARGD